MRFFMTLIAAFLWTGATAEELKLPVPHDGFLHHTRSALVSIRDVPLVLPSATGGETDPDGQYTYSLKLTHYSLINLNTGEFKPRQRTGYWGFQDRKVTAGELVWDGTFRVPRFHGYGDYEYEYRVTDDEGTTAITAFIIRLGDFEADEPERPEPPPPPIPTSFYILPLLSLADQHVHRVSVLHFGEESVKYEWEFYPESDKDHTASETALGVLRPGVTTWNVNDIVKLERGNRIAAVLCIEHWSHFFLVSDSIASKGDGSMGYQIHEARHSDDKGCEAVPPLLRALKPTRSYAHARRKDRVPRRVPVRHR